MKYSNENFFGSWDKESDIPDKYDLFNEVMLIGRSNAGKSSLINLLLGSLSAKVSNVPGKTQQINLFKYSNTINLLDLPGYGYSKKSKELRDNWLVELASIVLNRKSLKLIILLSDIRHAPAKVDLDFLNWVKTDCSVPILLVLTKSDKLKPREVTVKHNQIINSNLMNTVSDVCITSIKDTSSIKKIKKVIDQLN